MVDERKIIIDVPHYKGKDRREGELVVGLCGFHLKHSQQIKDTEKDIAEMKSDIGKVEDNTREDHQIMWKDIKAKVSHKLFYIFVTVYTAFFIGGVVGMYHKLGTVNENLIEKISTLQINVKMVGYDLKFHKVTSNKIEKDIEKVSEKVDRLTREVRKNGNGYRKKKGG